MSAKKAEKSKGLFSLRLRCAALRVASDIAHYRSQRAAQP